MVNSEKQSWNVGCVELQTRGKGALQLWGGGGGGKVGEREEGKINERPRNDHVILGPMRGLGKFAPNGADRQTDRSRT